MNQRAQQFFRQFARSTSIGFAALALILSASRASAWDMICRSPGGIEGFNFEYHAAEHYLAANTSDPRELQIYITNRERQIYVHSNFVTDTMITDHQNVTAQNVVPTKFTTDKHLDLPAIVGNILGEDHFDMEAYQRLNPDIVVYIEESTFQTRWGDIDFGSAKVNIVDDAHQPWRTELFSFPGGSRERLVAFDGFFSHVKDARESAAKVYEFRNRALRADDIRILPLTTNSATLKELRKGVRDLLVEDSIASIADLRDLFARARGKTFVVLGHFETGAFSMRDAGGKVIATIPLEDLSRLARDNGVGLVPLGCHTASLGGGSATKFNTLLAAKRMVKATKAENYADFISAIGGDDMAFVFDPAATASFAGDGIIFDAQVGDARTAVRAVVRVATVGYQPPPPQPASAAPVPVEPPTALTELDAGVTPNTLSGTPSHEVIAGNDSSDFGGGIVWTMFGGVILVSGGAGSVIVSRRRRARISMEESLNGNPDL